MDLICQGKSSWPELVGTRAQDAAEIIERENSLVATIIVYMTCPVPLDFSCNRVNIVIDCSGTVITVPTIG
ncbi:unnamed protein product [Ilex paraguariensis]|uniref:Uncharacterized protein n=1 Tax=Ilex paraguariensis TaxID=185542 RepID=A0ABC8T630_9AQUA